MYGHLEKILTIACEHMVEFVDIALSYTCNGQSVRICDKIRSRRINLAQTVLFRTLPNCPNTGLLHYFSERTRKMAKNVFLAFRPIIWDVATHIQGIYYHAKPLVLTTLKMSWFAINSILSGLIRQDKEYFSKKKNLLLVAIGRDQSSWEATKRELAPERPL